MGPEGPDLVDICKEAERLAARIVALPELAMRRAVMCEWLASSDPTETVEMLAVVLKGSRSGNRSFYITLLAFVAALGGPSPVPYELQRALYSRTKDRHAELGRLFLSALTPTSTEAIGGTPLALAGRPLTLGERKQLARGGRRDLLDRLLRDPDPSVIRLLLGNPRLTEADVVAIAARRPTRPELQREVFAARRWIARYRIKRALVLNPHTPTDLALRLLCFLSNKDLGLVRTDTELEPPIRAMAEELLRRGDAPRRSGSIPS